uniref:Nuclear Testis protein N-terminal domain-containing protein n=1 Tax=Mandrillus leucophaeus TaxID=9568 RepID=A0A2K5XRV6_MANLE
MEVKGKSDISFCCESGQFESCLKRCTPSVLLPSSWKGNSGSCLMAEAVHRMSPTPTSCPLPLPLCRMSGGASAEPGHSLGPTLDFSYCGNCQTAVVSVTPSSSPTISLPPHPGTGCIPPWRQGPGVGTRWAWDEWWAYRLGLTSLVYSPVLRSLARRKPTMSLEEGLWRAVREWQHTSNFDRMIFYEMAEKFLEFEAEEEMQIQKSQLMKGPQCLPPPAPPRLEPQGLPAPEADKQPVYLPSKAGPKAPTACLPPPRPQRTAETKARLPPRRPHRRAETKARLPTPRPQRPAETKVPEEIPPEVVQEYVDIMEELLGPPLGATGEPEKQREEGEVKQPQEEDWTPPDPGLLSYIDKLCSQKDFVTKVEAVIHPRFLEELLSPDPQMDFLALSQELEQEEGLTLAQPLRGGKMQVQRE